MTHFTGPAVIRNSYQIGQDDSRTLGAAFTVVLHAGNSHRHNGEKKHAVVRG